MKSKIFQIANEKFLWISALQVYIDQVLMLLFFSRRLNSLRCVHNIPSLNNIPGQNPSNIFVGNLEKRRRHIFILRLSDLQSVELRMRPHYFKMVLLHASTVVVCIQYLQCTLYNTLSSFWQDNHMSSPIKNNPRSSD